MKKIVKGNNIICYRGVEEHIDDYLALLKKYFRVIGHHYMVHHRINKNAILIFSYFPFDISCNNCDQKQSTIRIPQTSTMPLSSVFYDLKTTDIPCSALHKIIYGSKPVGYYCRKNNVFITGDIAHNAGQEEHINTLLEGMEKAGLLSQVTGDGKKISVTLGADPEMETSINGNLVSAYELPQLCTREKTYISHDGMTQPQRELRPDPADSPEELVENIRDLIKISSFFGEDLSVVGKSLSLGGHIHIGNASPSRELTMVLDYFLSPFNEFNTNQRTVSKYGKLGDVRVQPHGFEYRTPPAAWLLTPTLALMTLQLTKNVVERIVNEIDVEISDNLDQKEYEYNVEQLGFTHAWVVQFMNEIAWAKIHIDEPLAKTWNVEVPQEHRIKKSYRGKPRAGHPFTEPVRVPEPSPPYEETILEDDDDDDNGDEE